MKVCGSQLDLVFVFEIGGFNESGVCPNGICHSELEEPANDSEVTARGRDAVNPCRCDEQNTKRDKSEDRET